MVLARQVSVFLILVSVTYLQDSRNRLAALGLSAFETQLSNAHRAAIYD
jgi:hypothetical protein